MSDKVYAILIAGGIGSRMKSDIPKQFLSIFDRPVISYTLEAFQKDTNVDGIVVVCLEGWDHFVDAIAKQYKITKYIGTCLGGATGQESIWNGLNFLRNYADLNDLVLIHDANRPLVSSEIIDDSIRVTRKHGNAIPVIPVHEVVLKNSETSEGESNTVMPRTCLKRTQTPQGCKLGKLIELHEKARKEGRSYVATVDLLVAAGFTVFYSKGSEINIKLTTQEDIEIVKALLEVGHRR